MRFKRRSDEADEAATEAVGETGEPAPEEAPGEAAAPPSRPASTGPRDVAEAAELVDAENVVDLGSLLVPLGDGMDLRLQVDEESGQVLAALVVGEEGLLELRAFAAPRNGDLWGDVRQQIAAETAQHGGTSEQRTGPLGPELYCEVQVQVDDGSTGIQPSRIFGWNGPRWFLRGALLGRPAMEADQAGPWEELFTRIAVRRGDEAMAPGDALPLTLPPQAVRLAE